MASQRTRRHAARTTPPRSTSSPATHETERAEQALRILVRTLARQAARDAFERERRSQQRPDISEEVARP